MKPLPEPAAIILAAGFSRRFGDDKLLVSMPGAGWQSCVIVCTLQRWLSVFERVFVVRRPEQLGVVEHVRSGLEHDHDRITWIIAPDAAQGMGSSLAAGVRACSEASSWLIGLADMPAVTSTTIAAVKQLLQDGRMLVAPEFEGKRGHPVGFSSRYAAELQSLSGDQGARSLLQRDADLLHMIPVNDPGILLDIDTPQDLIQLRTVT